MNKSGERIVTVEQAERWAVRRERDGHPTRPCVGSFVAQVYGAFPVEFGQDKAVHYGGAIGMSIHFGSTRYGYSGPCPKPPLPKPTRLVVNVPYRVAKMTVNPQRYGEPTAILNRDDGIAGHLQISGPGADELEVGKVVKITVE